MSIFDTSRRGFLKLLGAATATAAARPTDLFAGVSLIGHGTTGHIVFEGVSPLLGPYERASYLTEERGNISGGRGTIEMRSPHTHSLNPRLREKPWTPFGESIVFQSEPFPDEDPLISFFMGAENLRDKIRADSHKEGFITVTIVDMPIMAIPLQDKGFFLQCELRQFHLKRGGLVNEDSAVSTNGEIPMETPSEVELKYLMLVQEELRQMGMLGQPKRQHISDALRRLRGRGVKSSGAPSGLIIPS